MDYSYWWLRRRGGGGGVGSRGKRERGEFVEAVLFEWRHRGPHTGTHTHMQSIGPCVEKISRFSVSVSASPSDSPLAPLYCWLWLSGMWKY